MNNEDFDITSYLQSEPGQFRSLEAEHWARRAIHALEGGYHRHALFCAFSSVRNFVPWLDEAKPTDGFGSRAEWQTDVAKIAANNKVWRDRLLASAPVVVKSMLMQILTRTLDLHNLDVIEMFATAWTSDSRMMLTGSQQKGFHIWQYENLNWAITHSVPPMNQKVIGRDYLGIGGYQGAGSWMMDDGQVIYTTFVPSSWLQSDHDRESNRHSIHWAGVAVTALAISGNKTHVATGHSDGSIRLWQVDNSETHRVIRGEGQSIVDLSLSSDGTRMAVCEADGTVQILDAVTGEQVRVIKGTENHIAMRVYWLDHDKYLFISARIDSRLKEYIDFNSVAHIWDTHTGELVVALDVPVSERRSPDGRFFIDYRERGDVWVFDAVNREPIALMYDPNPAFTAGWSPDSRWITGKGTNTPMLLWDTHRQPTRQNKLGEREVLIDDMQLLFAQLTQRVIHSMSGIYWDDERCAQELEGKYEVRDWLGIEQELALIADDLVKYDELCGVK